MAQENEKATVGAVIRERRYMLEVDIDEVAEEIGVQAKHLRRIEKGQWQALPSSVYTKGFIKKYARALGMDAQRLCDAYEKETATKPEVAETGLRPWQRKSASVLLSKVTRKVIVVVAFVAVLGYITYQLSIVFADPNLIVTEPTTEETIVGESTVVLAGRTDPGTRVLLNEQTLEVGPDGTFRKDIELLSGINTLVVSAVSRFDRRTEIVRTVIYREQPQTLMPSSTDGIQESTLKSSSDFPGGNATSSTSTDNN